MKEIKGWNEYRISDLFDIENISLKLTTLDLLPSGEVPVYSSDTGNGGICGYTNCKPSFYITPSKPIYIVFGDHTCAINIARQDFCVMDNVRVLCPKKRDISDRALLYIATVWQKAIPDLGYARHWQDAKKAVFKLPVSCDGNLDFEYMEEYISEIESEYIIKLKTDLPKEYKMYLKFANLQDDVLNNTDKDVLLRLSDGREKFKNFRIGDLFDKLELKTKADFDKMKDTSPIMTTEFNIPLINAKHGDNGIMFYGRDIDCDFAEGTIGIVQNGAIATGDVYPHPEKTGVLWDAYLIKPKFPVSADILMYLSCALQKTIKQRFDYDNKATWDKVHNVNMLLPVTNDESIDFSFIENYINAIKKVAVNNLYKRRLREIDVAREIIGVYS